MTRKIKRYGWRPDLPDQRDLVVKLSTRRAPKSASLLSKMPAVYDQGELGSCTANAIAGAVQYLRPDLMPSRLFVYYNERAIEGTVDDDSGAMIRDGIKSIHHQGVCPETEWPYDVDRFADKPSAKCYVDALLCQSIRYRRVIRTANAIKLAISDGLPIVFGFTVYESFESQQVADTGKLPMPGKSEQAIGGHAVLAVGYDGDGVLVRNSWGSEWGLPTARGYFTMPIAYLLEANLSDDFWVVSQLEPATPQIK
jgi:C1A family cysteine protease